MTPVVMNGTLLQAMTPPVLDSEKLQLGAMIDSSSNKLQDPLVNEALNEAL